jgi:outer membrane protein assembly factor BamB
MKALRNPLALGVIGLLAACSSGAPKAPDLVPLTPIMSTRLAWSTQVGATLPGQRPLAVPSGVLLTNAAGVLRELDAATGAVRWQANVGVPLNTGAGSDGNTAAVVSQGNELIAVRGGARVWSQRLPAPSYTPPLVAGQRVFVLTADRSVVAFDAANGARLWISNRPADPLVLRHPGALLAVGDTLVAGVGGRLQGVDPNNGRQRWSVALATPRGTNEVERLVDVVGPVARLGTQVCARAYSAVVACVDARDGTLQWSKASTGLKGVAGNDVAVFGSDSNGRVRAWARQDGRELWSVDRLSLRSLSAPLAVGRVVVLADDNGLVHVLSREDGSDMARLNTDPSGAVAEPVLSGNTLLVQTQNGGVFAWLPE